MDEMGEIGEMKRWGVLPYGVFWEDRKTVVHFEGDEAQWEVDRLGWVKAVHGRGHTVKILTARRPRPPDLGHMDPTCAIEKHFVLPPVLYAGC
jgi:hypothetical protein